MKVKVIFYDSVKYQKESYKVGEIEYEIDGFKVVGGTEADEIEKNLSADSLDEFKEYLVLKLQNGQYATFRNSYVDMFKLI